LVVVAISVPPALLLPPDTLRRAIWSTSELVLGVLMILAAQFWALMEVASEDEGLGAKDLFLSGRLWWQTCKRLPQTSGQVWLGTWGLAAVLSSFLIIGDLEHWLRYLPQSRAAAAREALEKARQVAE